MWNGYYPYPGQHQAAPPFVQVPTGIDPESFVKVMDFLDKRGKNNSPQQAGGELERYLRLIDRLERKEEKKKKAKEEEDKKKKEADKKKAETTGVMPMFSLVQVFLLLMVFGLPFGVGQLMFLKACAKLLKDMIITP